MNRHFINRKGQPENLLTVDQWRAFGKKHAPPINFKKAMWKFAEKNGIAVAMMADDKLLTFGKVNGSIRQVTYKPGTWTFNQGEAQ